MNNGDAERGSMMTRRVKALMAKKRLTVIHDNDDIIITAPADASSPPTTLDVRSKSKWNTLSSS
jgi:hypothetical protein